MKFKVNNLIRRDYENNSFKLINSRFEISLFKFIIIKDKMLINEEIFIDVII
jgi:hypothetical protein